MSETPRVRLGYWLSSEEHSAPALVANAVAAEQAGFTTAMISDHFHPWVPEQGQSPFVWSVLGAIAHATTSLRIGTGVTAPILRTHPTAIAQAAATVATLMPGRFFLGLGTGEQLNEHIVGKHWPAPAVRREMLVEAVQIMRRLFSGEEMTYDGSHFQVEYAQLYSRPDEPVPILLAAAGPTGAKLAGEHGDGLITTSLDHELVDAFEGAGGRGKPRIGQVRVSYATDRDTAVKTAAQWWPTAALPHSTVTEIARSKLFADLSAYADPEAIADTMVCGSDPKEHLDAIESYAAAGFSEVYVHQVGPDQQGMIDFYAEHILPALR